MKSAFNELKNQHRHLDYGLLLAVIICSAGSSLLIYSIHANYFRIDGTVCRTRYFSDQL